MGMFSWNCTACTHSVREGHESDWMTKVVVLKKDGGRWIGQYNGYGHVGAMDLTEMLGERFEVMHHACWCSMGRPEWQHPSPSAPDQGLTSYVLDQPVNPHHVTKLREKKVEMDRAQREETKAHWTKYVAELKAKGEEVEPYALRLAETGQ